MNTKEIESIKKILKREIAETEYKISNYKKLSPSLEPDNAIGRVSRMDAINNKSVLDASLQEAKNKLAQLKLMRKKTEKRYFGICKSCKKNIPFGRLMLIPHAQLCIDCAD